MVRRSLRLLVRDVVASKQVILYPENLSTRVSMAMEGYGIPARTLLRAPMASTFSAMLRSPSGTLRSAVCRTVCTQPSVKAQSRSVDYELECQVLHTQTDTHKGRVMARRSCDA